MRETKGIQVVNAAYDVTIEIDRETIKHRVFVDRKDGKVEGVHVVTTNKKLSIDELMAVVLVSIKDEDLRKIIIKPVKEMLSEMEED